MGRGALLWLLIGGLLLTDWTAIYGQAVPVVPFDLEFAGVTVHVNEEARKAMQQEVDRLYANRAALLRDLESLRQITPLLESRLADDRLPADFRYAALPFADQPDYGYWGLTIADAGRLKLRINPSVDERFHPILSTDAVVERLAELQLQSGNYAQTLLQYLQSVSPGSRQASSKYTTYLLLTEKSPPLLWKILARKFAIEHEEPAFRSGSVYLLFEYPDAGGQTIAGIGRQLNLGQDRFTPFNQWLKTTVIPTDKQYSVLIRVTAEEFPRMRSGVRSQTRPAHTPQMDVGFPLLVKKPQQPASIYSPAVYYTINGLPGVQAQPCDNVITMAYYGNMRIESFIADNDLTSQDVIHPGQIYYLAKKAKRAKVPFHVVQRGQTLREIANMYGVRLKSLLKFNRIPANQRVQPGRIIWLQRKRPKRRPVEYQQTPASPEPDNEPTVAIQQDVQTLPADTSTTEVPVSATLTAVNITTSPASVSATPVPAPVRPTERVLNTPVRSSVTSVQRPAKATSSDEAVKRPAPRPDTAQAEPREIVKLHVVRAGQTYYSIARQYGVAVGQLYAWNNLAERYPLEIGQEIIVSVVRVPTSIITRTPPKASVKAAPITRSTPQPPAIPNRSSASVIPAAGHDYYYTVQPGQTAYRVALINKVPVEELARWNNLKNYIVEVGQRLVIRKK